MRKGSVIALLAALCFCSAGVFVRNGYLAGIQPGTAVFLRFAISTLVLVLFLTISRRWVAVPPGRLLVIFLLGFVGYTILGTTFYLALGLLPIRTGIVDPFVEYLVLALSGQKPKVIRGH